MPTPGERFRDRLERAARRLNALRVRRKFRPSDPAFQSGRRLFFVTSRAKSGTTWMGRLLGSHPRLFCDTSENYAFHLFTDVRHLGLWWEDSPNAERIMEYPLGRLAELAANGVIANLIRRCDKPGAERLGDKTPDLDVGRLLARFPEARCVIMLRDPRDACVSAAFHDYRRSGSWRGRFTGPEMGGLDDAFARAYLEDYARRGDRAIHERALERHPDRVVRVRFEELVAEPEQVLAGVLALLGVSSEPAIVRRCVARNSFERLSGRKPGTEDPGSPFRRGTVGDWRNHLSPENVATFKELAGGDLVALGYERDAGWDLE